MADFISDEEMEKLEREETPDFISDEEMESMDDDQPFLSAQGLKKAAIESLPIAGGLAGTLGGIPGVMAGAAAGKALENIAERYLLDEEKSRPEIYAGPAGEALAAATGEMAAPLVSRGLSKITSGIGKGLKKTVSAFSSIPEKAIETYIDRPGAVKNIGQLSEETALQEAADDLRRRASVSISEFKNDRNSEIGYILAEKGNKLVDVSGIKKIAEESLAKLDPRLDAHRKLAENITSQLDQLSSLIVNPKEKYPYAKAVDVHNLKQVLQDSADYIAANNPMNKDDIASTTIRRMASRAKQAVESVAPEIKTTNQQLSQLHRINRNINKNLISPEKTAASVFGVGSGQNQQAIKQMRKLEDLIGFPYVEQAQNIVSAQYFNKPSLLPTISTGRAMLPMSIGGYQAADQALQGNIGPAIGGAALAATGSPMAIKAGMDIGMGAGRLARAATPLGSAEMAEQLMQRALQMGVSPFIIDGMIKNSEEISATVKAKLRNKNAKAVK
jgi:hypothetical protein